MDFAEILRRSRWFALTRPADPAAPAHRRASDRLWDRLAGMALVAAVLLVVVTFTDYGVTWDEDVHNWYGILALDYYLSLFAD